MIATLGLAFLAGILSTLSPCVMPLIPLVRDRLIDIDALSGQEPLDQLGQAEPAALQLVRIEARLRGGPRRSAGLVDGRQDRAAAAGLDPGPRAPVGLLKGVRHAPPAFRTR